ncbi:hypothetical protein ES288_D11G276100v1, partial [Gossypium darwinii]
GRGSNEERLTIDTWHPKMRKGVVRNEMLWGVKNNHKRQPGKQKHLSNRMKRKQNKAVKCQTLDDDSPVAENITSLRSDPSSMGHVESHLTGHLWVKHYFGVGHESGTKSRQTLNTRYDLKIIRVEGCRDSQEVFLETATLERVRNSSLIERSCTKYERG